MKGFAEITTSLHKMTGKGVYNQWSPDCQDAFECLKQALITSPILTMPTDEDRYVLETDTRNHSIEAVLSDWRGKGDRVRKQGLQQGRCELLHHAERAFSSGLFCKAV